MHVLPQTFNQTFLKWTQYPKKEISPSEDDFNVLIVLCFLKKNHYKSS